MATRGPAASIRTTDTISWRNKTNEKTANLPFIVSVGKTKPDPATRQLIRTHVMLGKNRGKRTKKQRQTRGQEELRAEALDASQLVSAGTIPRWLTSKFSGIRFADQIEPPIIENVMNVMSAASRAVFLLDRCIMPNEDGVVQAWFAPLLFDAAYLHAICLATQSYFESFRGRRRFPQDRQGEYVSFSKTVVALQRRLARNDSKELLADSTIMTVWALSGYAYSQGDYQAACQHNIALLKLVCMKGPYEFIHKRDTKLVTEIIRTDLCMCYESGQMPALFTYDTIPWPLVSFEDHRSKNEDISHMRNRLDPDLAKIWDAMSSFCNLVNRAASNEAARVVEDTFLHAMGSTLYRLLYLRYRQGTLNEAVRLTLLAFSIPVFLDWKMVYRMDGHFVKAWRHALANVLMECTFTTQDSIWVLMNGALSMSHDPVFLKKIISDLRIITELSHVATWEDMKEILSSYLWIELLFERPAQDIFASMMTYSGLSSSLYQYAVDDLPTVSSQLFVLAEDRFGKA